jgi:hypothetical protein
MPSKPTLLLLSAAALLLTATPTFAQQSDSYNLNVALPRAALSEGGLATAGYAAAARDWTMTRQADA